MRYEHPFSRWCLFRRFGAIWCAVAALPILAADPAAPPALPDPVERAPQIPPSELPDLASLNPPGTSSPIAAPSQNVTVNLINRLVERGVLPKQDAADLIKLAEDDAAVARAQDAT